MSAQNGALRPSLFEPESGADGAERQLLLSATRIAEALLFASAEPITRKALAERLPEQVSVNKVMAALEARYAYSGVNLVRVDDAWALRTAPDLAYLLRHDAQQQPKKLSRAALEVLATIAYHQPVTRAEIEDVRGVETSKGTLDLLMESGWVRMRGRRRTPGRPVTYGTTPAFLDHFGLSELRDLPGMEDLKGAGLLSPRLPTNFSVPVPLADPGILQPDEDDLGDVDLEELGLLTPRVTED